ncbi:MAG: hypothetical protein WC121_11965 [Candidatus Kapaibacterium sp.]|jgi:IgA-specific serine endopeptidase
MPTATEATAAIAEYSPTESALAELRTKYADTAFDLASTAGNKAARAARLELVTLRTSLERKRKELKAPALEYAKRIDTEARRITDEILSLETPIDEQIKADEARREQEKQAREAAERERVEAIIARLEEIKATVSKVAGRSSVVIAAEIEALEAKHIGDDFEEFRERAQAAKDAALDSLRDLHARVTAQEEEARRLREEREALRREREAQEKAAAEARATEEARQREERARQEAEIRAAREAEEAAAAERRRREDEERAARQAEIDAEAARLAAEREAFDRAQRERAEQEAAARDAQESAERAEREAREAKERAEREAREAAERAARQREAERMGRLQAASEQMFDALRMVRASAGFTGLGREAQESVVDAIEAATEPEQAAA